LALQVIGWISICNAALKHHLIRNEKSALAIGENGKFGYFTFTLYSLLAIAHFGFHSPLL